jgi:two-component system LytT family sensor kinase
VEKEIDATALESRVPTLILQPLVENAVRHGIEPQTAPGVIRIRARRDGSTLRLTVQDTGTVTGAKPAARQREGIGLPNTRARLQELYGDLGRMTLTNGVEGGFQVELEFPCRTAATSPQVHAQTAT